MEEARLDNSTIEGIREVRGFIKLVEGELVGLEGELGGDLVGAVGARGGGWGDSGGAEGLQGVLGEGGGEQIGSGVGSMVILSGCEESSETEGLWGISGEVEGEQEGERMGSGEGSEVIQGSGGGGWFVMLLFWRNIFLDLSMIHLGTFMGKNPLEISKLLKIKI